MNRVLHILSAALITAGIVILADVATTLAWKEPVSSLYGSIRQHQAESELTDLESSFPSDSDLRKVKPVENPRKRAALLARLLQRRVEEGDAIGRIAIPRIDLDVVAVQGTDTASLQKGPGHYPRTPMPGLPGTTAFAGHRTTYLAPFRHLDELHRGDRIEVQMPYADFSYRVQSTRVVEPSEVGIVRGVGYQRLVLTACHPLYSAAQRIAAFAKLDRVTSTPVGDRGSQSP